MQGTYRAAAVAVIGACVLIGYAVALPRLTIEIVDYAYEPPGGPTEIDSPITWMNTGTVTHTVTFDDGTIDSGPIAPGKTFSASIPTGGALHVSLQHPSVDAGRCYCLSAAGPTHQTTYVASCHQTRTTIAKGATCEDRPAILLTLAVLVALFAAFPASAVRRKCPG